jgi:hypothetical protein
VTTETQTLGRVVGLRDQGDPVPGNPIGSDGGRGNVATDHDILDAGEL